MECHRSSYKSVDYIHQPWPATPGAIVLRLQLHWSFPNVFGYVSGSKLWGWHRLTLSSQFDLESKLSAEIYSTSVYKYIYIYIYILYIYIYRLYIDYGQKEKKHDLALRSELVFVSNTPENNINTLGYLLQISNSRLATMWFFPGKTPFEDSEDIVSMCFYYLYIYIYMYIFTFKSTLLSQWTC